MSAPKTFTEYVESLRGRKIVFETMEGVIRHGELTKIVTSKIRCSDTLTYEHPETLYLDNDPADAVLIRRLVRLEPDDK